MNNKKGILNFMEAFPTEESCIRYFESLLPSVAKIFLILHTDGPVFVYT